MFSHLNNFNIKKCLLLVIIAFLSLLFASIGYILSEYVKLDKLSAELKDMKQELHNAKENYEKIKANRDGLSENLKSLVAKSNAQQQQIFQLGQIIRIYESCISMAIDQNTNRRLKDVLKTIQNSKDN